MIKLYALKTTDNKLVIIEDKFVVLPQEPESYKLLMSFIEDNPDVLKGCTVARLNEVIKDCEHEEINVCLKCACHE